jgi:hypothetical protein
MPDFTRADPVAGEGKKTLRPPFAGEAVLHLWKN